MEDDLATFEESRLIMRAINGFYKPTDFIAKKGPDPKRYNIESGGVFTKPVPITEISENTAFSLGDKIELKCYRTAHEIRYQTTEPLPNFGCFHNELFFHAIGVVGESVHKTEFIRRGVLREGMSGEIVKNKTKTEIKLERILCDKRVFPGCLLQCGIREFTKYTDSHHVLNTCRFGLYDERAGYIEAGKKYDRLCKEALRLYVQCKCKHRNKKDSITLIRDSYSSTYKKKEVYEEMWISHEGESCVDMLYGAGGTDVKGSYYGLFVLAWREEKNKCTTFSGSYKGNKKQYETDITIATFQ